MSDDSMWRPPDPGETPSPPPPQQAQPTQPSLPPLGPPSAPGAPGVGAPPSQYPSVDIDPPAPRKRRGALIGAVIGVVAIGAAGTFAVTRMVGGDEGGAASPQQVGERFLGAIEDEDVLGMIDLLLPGERETFRQPLIDLVSELSRVEVLSPGADLSSVDGLDIVVDDEFVRVNTTNVGDITNIEIGGQVSATVDGEALPIGDLILDTTGADPSELDTTADPERFSFPVTTVERDGRWYLSLFYSVAEQGRGALADLPDIPAVGIEAAGGENPEGAVDTVLTALEDLDLTALIGAINPHEAEALQRYAPLFLDDPQSALDEVPFAWQVEQVEYDVTGSGSSRGVDITLLAISGNIDGEQFSLELVDGCAVVEAQGERFDSCELAAGIPQLDDVLDEPGPVQEFIDAVSDAFADYDSPAMFAVERIDGQWYVSPIGSGFDQLLAVLRALDRAEVDELITKGEGALNSFFEQMLGVDFDISDPTLPVDPFPEDSVPDASVPGDSLPQESVPGDTVPGTAAPGVTVPATVPGDSVPVDTIPGESGSATRCYTVLDVNDAIECFDGLLAEGEIEPYEVPLFVRFPECGLAQLWWEGDYYSLDDATFISTVTAAAPCFQALADSGAIEDYELPPELSDIECFEGRNWYSVFDDDEYENRVTECLYG